MMNTYDIFHTVIGEHSHNLTGKQNPSDADWTPCADLPHCPSMCDCPAGACTALVAPDSSPQDSAPVVVEPVAAPVVEPVAAPVADPVAVVTRHYLITDAAGTEYTGAVIGNCEPVEAMRTMLGIINNVSRETVNLVTNGSGWIWWVEGWLVVSPQGYGTARFLSTVETPTNPYK